MSSTLPQPFVNNITSLLKHEAAAFFESLQQPAPVSVRINPFKPSEVFPDTEHVPWCSSGRFLSERPQFTLDPLFHAGGYYVQEASSMFLEQIFLSKADISKSLKVLDLCAAPGGKSTLLLSLLNTESLLVSNEVIPKRNQVLCENIAKWGCANVMVTQSEASDFSVLNEFFDVILVDAPCSGEGLFRKDADAISHWSEANVDACSARQQNILRHVVPALKKDGLLIYSTCTFEEAENEQVVETLINTCAFEPANDVSHLPSGVVQNKFGYRFYPHKVKGEGFFISCLVKTGDVDAEPFTPFQSKKQIGFMEEKSVPTVVKNWLVSDAEAVWFSFKNEFCFTHKMLKPRMEQIARVVQVRQAGVAAGSEEKGNIVPSHAVAMCHYLSDKIPSIQLSKADALKYLKGESLMMQAEKGWHLVKFENLNLGWAKAVAGRLNNHYPKEWRIRMQL